MGYVKGVFSLTTIFLNVLQVEFWIFKYSSFHSLIVNGKEEYLKVSFLKWYDLILFEIWILYWLAFHGISSARYCRRLYVLILQKQHNHLNHFLHIRYSRPSYLYIIFREDPLIAPEIAKAALYWTDSSLRQKSLLFGWS